MKIRNCFSKEERRLKFRYREFIKSDWWEKQKLDWYSRHDKKCARCKSVESIHLHHKKYPKGDRFLSLDDNAFVALCKSCHKEFHLRNGVRSNMQKESNRFIKTEHKNSKNKEVKETIFACFKCTQRVYVRIGALRKLYDYSCGVCDEKGDSNWVFVGIGDYKKEFK